jgi:D-glycero-D-manno-heptose 1,7-bisphosphate phosphatase
MSDTPKKRAVFLDRDGTISREIGYINHADRYRLLPRTAQAIRLLNDSDYLTVVVTNQAGVARGYFTEDLIWLVCARMETLLAADGAFLDGIYYCPHHPRTGQPPYRADCNCRKPKTGMIDRAAADLDIDISRSWMVGDKISDIEFARGVGCGGAMVLTGYGRGEYTYSRHTWQVKPDHIAEDLLDTVEWILGQG